MRLDWSLFREYMSLQQRPAPRLLSAGAPTKNARSKRSNTRMHLVAVMLTNLLRPQLHNRSRMVMVTRSKVPHVVFD